MQIEAFRLFVMVDDSDNELFLTKSIFQHSFPKIAFLCEKNPAAVIDIIGRYKALGVAAAQICLLIDIRMPKMNGFELIYRVRNDIETYDCCIVMLSSSRAADDRDHSEAIGSDSFMAKPFSVPKLKVAIAERKVAERLV
ncbi:response regulator [Lichenifustis flavocetrariae]|uniref:Response regulator n=1 Tax=Lichenifustis flavocetrariae TaxID=2949735 RepID=A0AA41YUS1_9HYPH|nr:response regulator [Lichenifustis flavocetrariae]MCW6508514.1 response regulator [Lichenifustis flavocetrariae]